MIDKNNNSQNRGENDKKAELDNLETRLSEMMAVSKMILFENRSLKEENQKLKLEIDSRDISQIPAYNNLKEKFVTQQEEFYHLHAQSEEQKEIIKYLKTQNSYLFKEVQDLRNIATNSSIELSELKEKNEELTSQFNKFRIGEKSGFKGKINESGPTSQKVTDLNSNIFNMISSSTSKCNNKTRSGHENSNKCSSSSKSRSSYNSTNK